MSIGLGVLIHPWRKAVNYPGRTIAFCDGILIPAQRLLSSPSNLPKPLPSVELPQVASIDKATGSLCPMRSRIDQRVAF